MRRFLHGARSVFDNGVGQVAVSMLMMAGLGYLFMLALRLVTR